MHLSDDFVANQTIYFELIRKTLLTSFKPAILFLVGRAEIKNS